MPARKADAKSCGLSARSRDPTRDHPGRDPGDWLDWRLAWPPALLTPLPAPEEAGRPVSPRSPGLPAEGRLVSRAKGDQKEVKRDGRRAPSRGVESASDTSPSESYCARFVCV